VRRARVPGFVRSNSRAADHAPTSRRGHAVSSGRAIGKRRRGRPPPFEFARLVSSRARHAAGQRSVRARGHAARAAADVAAQVARIAPRASQRTARTSLAHDTAVVIEAREGALAAGLAGAGAVGALAHAARIVALARDVAGSRGAHEIAAAPGGTAAVAIGARARAGIALAIDVARRAQTLELAVAVVPASAAAVGADAAAGVVVTHARDMARRVPAAEAARFTLVTHAVPIPAAIVVVIAAARIQRRQRSDQKPCEGREAKGGSAKHGRSLARTAQGPKPNAQFCLLSSPTRAAFLPPGRRTDRVRSDAPRLARCGFSLPNVPDCVVAALFVTGKTRSVAAARW